MKTSAETINDPAFAAHEREVKEREAREFHEKQLGRGRPSAYREPVSSGPAAIREMITGGRKSERRTFSYEHDLESKTRHAPKGEHRGR